MDPRSTAGVWKRKGIPPVAMTSPRIDAETFCARLKLLYRHWRKQPEVWEDAGSICVAAGPASDDFRYLKSVALHIWLFGYELPGAKLAASVPPRSPRPSGVNRTSLPSPLSFALPEAGSLGL